MIAHVEYTDLFAGEPKYCWVKRFDFDAEGMSDSQMVRYAKKRLGISGKRAIYSHNQCDLARYFKHTVLFITFDY